MPPAYSPSGGIFKLFIGYNKKNLDQTFAVPINFPSLTCTVNISSHELTKKYEVVCFVSSWGHAF